MMAADKHFWEHLHVLTATVSLVVFLLVWQFVSFRSSPFILPSPFTIYNDLGRLVSSGILLPQIIVTVSRLIVGVLLALPVGLLVGIVLRHWAGQLLIGLPFTAVSKVPPTAWGPLTYVAVGPFQEVSMWVVVTLAAAVPLALAIVRDVSPFSDGESVASPARSMFRRPAVFAGWRAGILSGFAALVAAEFGRGSGLGYLLTSSSDRLEVSQVYALIICLAGVGYALQAAVDWLQTRLAYRARDAEAWNVQPAISGSLDRSAVNVGPAHK